MLALKFANKTLSFFIELAVILAYGNWGFAIGTSSAWKWILAILSASLAVVCWTAFAAPKSSTRLNYPAIVVFKLLFFMMAATLVFLMGQKLFAGIFALIILINILLEILFNQ